MEELASLDPNVLACVLRHLAERDLARVAVTCKRLAHESTSDVVWCTRFLHRFGLDFWGEAEGPHPYSSVPDEKNDWLELGAGEVFEAFSARVACDQPPPTASDDEDEDDHNIARGLCDFAQRHATRPGYGGWKQAYRRMYDMVQVWTKPTTASLMVAGLPQFSVLSAIASGISDETILCPLSNSYVEDDVVSPYGECRVIRTANVAQSAFYTEEPHVHTTNICVIRKPRNWCKTKLFRGLTTTRSLCLVYVVDAPKLERSQAYEERVYRELHGTLGEAKGCVLPRGHLMCLLDVDVDRELAIMERLRIPRYVPPHHHCPYYDSAVAFAVASFASPRSTEHDALNKALFGPDDDDDDDDRSVNWEAEAQRQAKLAQGVEWLAGAAFGRIPVNHSPTALLVCALSGSST